MITNNSFGSLRNDVEMDSSTVKEMGTGNVQDNDQERLPSRESLNLFLLRCEFHWTIKEGGGGISLLRLRRGL